MQNLLTVAFEAHHAERNHHRRYEIMIGRDLLDTWTVSIRYGRIGNSGSETSYSSKQVAEAQEIVHDRLRRRLSAPRRIGCGYRLTMLDSMSGFDLSRWLPVKLMTGMY